MSPEDMICTKSNIISACNKKRFYYKHFAGNVDSFVKAQLGCTSQLYDIFILKLMALALNAVLAFADVLPTIIFHSVL